MVEDGVEQRRPAAEARIIAHSALTEKQQLSPRLRPPGSRPGRTLRVWWLLRAEATSGSAPRCKSEKKTLAYMFWTSTMDTILHMALPKSHLKSRAFSTAQKGRVSTNWKSVSARLVTKRLMEDLRQPCLLFIR